MKRSSQSAFTLVEMLTVMAVIAILTGLVLGAVGVFVIEKKFAEAAAFALTGAPLTFSPPQMGRFNVRGGLEILPEFAALTVALTTYTAGFIAEVVRAGVLSVSAGQAEAAHALGLRPGATLRLVIVPQAMRVIIPPLTSQYLNLTKNSSLAVAIGYPDLVAIGGTILNQTGQSIEVIVIWMVIYLSLSLGTATFMNWFNAKMALVER